MKNFYHIIVMFFIFAFSLKTSFAQTIVSYGSSWKYLDTNTRPAGWELSGFADGGWPSGPGQLGYGDGDEATVVACAACSPKYITTYFRKTINIPDPTIYTNFTLNVKRDDGIVVYINGTERYADNMPAGRLHSTLASAVAADDGNTPQTTTLAITNFIAGNNVIAVEIHQNATTSSDITFDLELIGNAPGATTLTRGPYLQMGNQTGITIRWRTAAATNSRVTWGTSFGTYPNIVDDAVSTTEHEVRINGLSPDTKYYYTIGSTTQTLQATNTNYVQTLPPANTTRKLRFLALGDCGNASTNQIDVKNAALNYLGSNDLDALLTVGDNAYSSGLDNEFQLEFFDIYKDDLFRNKKLYMAPGNHDYGNSSANTGVRNNAYYNNFTLPTAGELGGTASGTEAYYSYDIGDVHFVALDSYGREDANTTKLYDTLGAQCVWLKNDLAVNTKKWVVVYFHHPPYTKTSHNSDTETADLMLIRERFIRILERYGVDLILCGHSHGYERSYLLKNYFNNPSSPLLDANFNIATHTATGNNQNAKYDGTANSCPYNYNSGQINHGSVYIVAGSSGQIGGSAAGYPHDAMYYSNNTNGGSFYFEVDSNRLDAKFLSYSGTGGAVVPVIRDQFTIFKDVNKTTNYSVATNAPLTLTASWRGTYYWPNNGGATTRSVTISNATNGTFSYPVRDANAGSCIQDAFTVTVSGTLPIALSSFTATLNKDKVLLDWTTSQEQNNKYFTIERSNDGSNFSFLNKVNGSGTTTESHSYHATDFAPLDGTNFYRLSQTDLDGNQKYYGIKTVNIKSSKNFKSHILNNGNGQIGVVMSSKKNVQISMRVVDMLGKEILTETIAVYNNSAVVKNLNLQPGVYVLVLTNETGEKITHKIIVK